MITTIISILFILPLFLRQKPHTPPNETTTP